MTTALEPATDPGLDDRLIADAREYAEWIGRLPGRNELKQTFRIGAPKAKALRIVLLGSDPDPGDDDTPVSPAPVTYYEPIATPAPAQVIERAPEPEPNPDPPVVDVVDVVEQAKRPSPWPVLLLALPAFVALWSGWVGLGAMTGFGIVHPLPGIADHFTLNSAITLPIGVEAYAAYAIRVWLSTRVSTRARQFARGSAIAALVLGAGGQAAYHLMASRHVTHAPGWLTIAVACLPVAVVGAGSALAHLVGKD